MLCAAGRGSPLRRRFDPSILNIQSSSSSLSLSRLELSDTHVYEPQIRSLIRTNPGTLYPADRRRWRQPGAPRARDYMPAHLRGRTRTGLPRCPAPSTSSLYRVASVNLSFTSAPVSVRTLPLSLRGSLPYRLRIIYIRFNQEMCWKWGVWRSLHEKGIKSELSGNEVHYTNSYHS